MAYLNLPRCGRADWSHEPKHQQAKGAEQSSPPPALKETPRLKDYYRDECVPQMMQEFRYKSPMQVPRLKKVVVNIGLGEAIQNIKLLESASAGTAEA